MDYHRPPPTWRTTLSIAVMASLVTAMLFVVYTLALP